MQRGIRCLSSQPNRTKCIKKTNDCSDTLTMNAFFPKIWLHAMVIHSSKRAKCKVLELWSSSMGIKTLQAYWLDCTDLTVVWSLNFRWTAGSIYVSTAERNRWRLIYRIVSYRIDISNIVHFQSHEMTYSKFSVHLNWWVSHAYQFNF